VFSPLWDEHSHTPTEFALVSSAMTESWTMSLGVPSSVKREGPFQKDLGQPILSFCTVGVRFGLFPRTRKQAGSASGLGWPRMGYEWQAPSDSMSPVGQPLHSQPNWGGVVESGFLDRPELTAPCSLPRPRREQLGA